MRDVIGARVILMVAQQPFTANENRFCNLIPICYTEDGARAKAAEFPNDGQVWWMLLGHTAHLARPGDFVMGVIEEAKDADSTDPTKSQYQVRRESVEVVSSRYAFEVIDIPASEITDITDLAEDSFFMVSDGRPMRRVMLRWKGNYYGPFRASFAAEPGDTEGNLTFAPESADGEIVRIVEADFLAVTRGHEMVVREDVSLEPQRRSIGGSRCRTFEKTIVVGANWDKIVAAAQQSITLESLRQKLHRYAKDCLGRKNRQEFNRQLDQLADLAKEKTNAEDILNSIARFKGQLGSVEDALNSVASALTATDMMGEGRLQEALARHADQWVEKQSATLQARLEEVAAQRRADLRDVETKLAEAKIRLDTEEAFRRRELDRELEEIRIRQERDFETEHDKIAKDREALEGQTEILKHSLEEVTRELHGGWAQVVNKYLTIRPLLGLGDIERAERADAGSTGLASVVAPGPTVAPPMRPLEIPLWASQPNSADMPGLSERDFFDRFQGYVERNGYAYRHLDLVRFHLSVKLGEMTVLGGPSGTGKSSLPMLYAAALRGEAAYRPSCLMVGVNPSWMDPRDLLGYLSAMDGEFHPSESGLFKHLVIAHEEYQRAKDASGVSVVCLDEMNLSQVEHYFSDFMMVLERSGEFRQIQSFDALAAGPNSVFRQYSRIQVAPSVSFVGTVNFDESTRSLSDRLLDRINLIRLSHEGLPTPGTPEAGGQVEGRHVTIGDFRRWTQEPTFPREQASMLDGVRPILGDLGIPVSPRVYRAMARYVSSAGEFLNAAQAFDIQFAQRIAPKVRGVMSEKRRAALDRLMDALEKAATFPESLALLEEARGTSSPRPWSDEE